MAAALELVASESNFSALSLRRIARRAGVVPTAFYRHFQDMDALGMALVEDTFGELRRMLRDADLPSMPIAGLTRYSVQLFALHVRDHRLLFQFLIKERYAGSAALRGAIQDHIGALIGELAHDLAQFDEFARIDIDDLHMIAELVVNAVIAVSERILDTVPDAAEDEALMLRAEKQLRLIFLGVGRWDSRVSRGAAGAANANTLAREGY
ncbi:TetR family transcriptional regulator [Salinisphaera sp.]|uniref:TetR family transcriptional regulator n=1 Tax=Salinisphaera sp. TaxID=1914330 RepID=UPI002D7839B8|nr:TetR family transcriptional regulator [Salinisphaera sp.]HET7314449.1 TetR family transcriptional regulator [Salinisphaera sp.]